MALDIGEIAAHALRRPVRELEIELTDGDPRAVLDAARDFVRRHGLWLDTQTKAHRGDQLAREAASGQPSPMPPARPRTRAQTGATPTQVWLASVDAALEQIGACLSEVALYATAHPMHGTGPTAPIADILDPAPWVRGWAVGLRRLAWAWRHAPATALAIGSHHRLHQAVLDQLATLRPGAGCYLDGDAAATLARSAAPTLLALDVLETVIALG